MEPNQFREARVEIGQLCKKISTLVDKKDPDESKRVFEKATQLLDVLSPQAEGEIQKRSVKNLGLKIKASASMIEKMKPGKKKEALPKNIINWDTERLAALSDTYLLKVFANMGPDIKSKVSFSAVGKGIRPSYQIDFGDDHITAFSGSGHKPLKKKLPFGPDNISRPFSRSTIESILEHK